jgi:CheY-like chemotaxis protein/anti-sigma regulatory factor (Ser/Thr protein kinase)
MEVSKIVLNNEEVDVRQMATNVIKMTEPLIKNKNVKVVLSYNSPYDIYLTDTTRLNQVLLNLINNSIKFTIDGIVRVVCDHEDGNLIISVIDTGIGIPKDKLDKIFNSFEQVDNSNTRGYGGTGLGLAITKNIITAMKGTIAVMSKEGIGTTFCVKLPLKTTQLQPVEDVVYSECKKNTVLIVEDIDLNAKIASKFIQRMGYSVEYAIDGSQAVEQVKKNDYDFILMDIQMPIMCGIIATKKIREMGKDVPIIACTAGVDDKQRKECEENMDGFIAKPYKFTQFKEVVENTLKQIDTDKD